MLLEIKCLASTSEATLQAAIQGAAQCALAGFGIHPVLVVLTPQGLGREMQTTTRCTPGYNTALGGISARALLLLRLSRAGRGAAQQRSCLLVSRLFIL